MVTSQKGLGPQKTTLARTSSIYKRQSRHLARKGAPEKQNHKCQKSNKYLAMSPRWGSIQGFIDWLTISLNVTLTLTITYGSTRTYLRDRTDQQKKHRVEAGSSASTVALRVVGGDENGTQCLGYNWATLFLGDINTGTGPSRLGSLESEPVKYGHESRGTRNQEWLRWRDPTAIVNGRPVLSSDKAP
jgi:hypothetical protein